MYVRGRQLGTRRLVGSGPSMHINSIVYPTKQIQLPLCQEVLPYGFRGRGQLGRRRTRHRPLRLPP